LRNLGVDGYGYSVNIRDICAQTILLDKAIRWDWDDEKYYICELKNNGEYETWEKVDGLEGFVPNQGKLIIPLKLLGKFTDIEYSQAGTINIDFVRGIGFTNPEYAYVGYETSLTGGGGCGRLSTDTEYYRPWSQYVGLEENAAFAYTGIYSDCLSAYKELTAVFSEENDTLPSDLLTAIAGVSNINEVWYGGELSGSGSLYLADRSQANQSDPTPFARWTVTRTTQGGPAWSAIKEFETSPAAPVYGSGALEFEKYKYLVVPSAQYNSLRVYHCDYRQYYIDNGISLPEEGTEARTSFDAHIMDFKIFYTPAGSNNPPQKVYLPICFETPFKEGWVRVDSTNNTEGYIFYGTGSVEHKLSVADGDKLFETYEPH